MNRQERIERISCFQDLIAREEKTALQQNEASIERITILQNAIEAEEQIILNQETKFFLSLVILKTVRRGLMQNITILSSDFFTNNVIIPVIKNFMNAKKDYIFELKNATGDTLPSDVDFSILPCPHPGSSDYVSETLLETELNLYGSPEYLEKYGEPKRLEDLNQHTLIRAQKGDLSRLTNAKYKPIFFKKECLKTDTLTASIRLAEQGMGIVCFNDKAFEFRKSKLEKINKLENTYRLPYIFNISNKIKNTPIVQELKNGINRVLMN